MALLSLYQDFTFLLSIYSRDSFLKGEDVQWICWPQVFTQKSHLVGIWWVKIPTPTELKNFK